MDRVTGQRGFAFHATPPIDVSASLVDEVASHYRSNWSYSHMFSQPICPIDERANVVELVSGVVPENEFRFAGPRTQCGQDQHQVVIERASQFVDRCSLSVDRLATRRH